MPNEARKLAGTIVVPPRRDAASSFWFVGTPDIVAKFGGQYGGRILSHQLKTASAYAKVDAYVSAIEMSVHERMYPVLVRAGHKFKCEGSLLTMLRKLAIPSKRRQKTETNAEGVKSTRVWNEPDEGAWHEWNPFVRVSITSSRLLEDDLAFTAQLKAESLQASLNEEPSRWNFAANPGACVSPFGGTCPYMELCKGLPYVPEAWATREQSYEHELAEAREMIAFSGSSLGDALDCERKWYFRHVERIAPRDDESAAMMFGTAIHRAIQEFHMPGTEREMRSPDGWVPCWNEDRAHLAFDEALPGEYDELAQRAIIGKSNRFAESREYGHQLLKRYFEVMGPDDRGIVERVYAIETKIACDEQTYRAHMVPQAQKITKRKGA